MSSPNSQKNTDLGPAPAHPQPRRASPEQSITLRHHRLAREASLRPNVSPSTAPTRQATPGGAVDTGSSSPANWFDHENRNTQHNPQPMDVDPPFFLKASDSSSTDIPPPPHFVAPHPATTGGQSSSADDYRSIVDDLTIQIQRLREENKRLRSRGPNVMKDEQLFEVRCHDLLSRRKKRELEATLREFAANLKDTQSNRVSGGSSQRKKSSSSRNQKAMYSSGSGTMSKHASSTASQSRPVDSAYASGSGPYSSGTSLTRPSHRGSAHSSGRKVENYLREIPEGLYQGPVALTDKDKKKTVVRRLEQIFTGKITGRSLGQRAAAVTAAANLPPPNMVASSLSVQPSAQQLSTQSSGQLPSGQQRLSAQSLTPDQPQATSQPEMAKTPISKPSPLQPRPPPAPPPSGPIPTSTPANPIEPHREAQMLPRGSGKKGRSRDNLSMSNSNGEDSGKNSDQTRPSSNAAAAATAATTNAAQNSTIASPLEQRPTRPLDLDPDRVQVPSENMEYLRHLGLVPPELLQGSTASYEDVPTDSDGWVYLNLLCNMAQLHIFSVTPDFIRAAVTEKSTKFQLSRDGNKIRWRGGCEGTRFSSDSSGDASQKSPMTDETEGSEGGDRHESKRQKLNRANDRPSAPSSKHTAHRAPAAMLHRTPTSSFHYKPLFARRESSQETSTDGSSSCDADESYNPGSQWGRSGSGSNQRRKKRRANGAVIYYSGAPFCTDLSRDPGEFSSDTYMLSEEHDGSETVSMPERPFFERTTSGSSLPFRPLSDGLDAFRANDDASSLGSDDVKDIDMTMPWSSALMVRIVMDSLKMDPKNVDLIHPDPMQASGTFGIEPQDHFRVTVTTHRQRSGLSPLNGDNNDLGDVIISRLESLTTSPPIAGPLDLRRRGPGPSLAIDYLSSSVDMLPPSKVPEPLSYLPCTDTSSSYNSAVALSPDVSDEAGSASELMSRRANPHHSDDPDSPMGASSGAVADGELEDNDENMVGDSEERSKGSSVATAGGGVASGYSSGLGNSPV